MLRGVESVRAPDRDRFGRDVSVGAAGLLCALVAACSEEDLAPPLACPPDLHVRTASTPIQRVVPRSFELELAEADLAHLFANPYEEIFAPCRLAVDGARYDEGCEVRISGGSSRDYPKKSFRITYPEGARSPGYSRKINLRAEYNDASFLRNYLAHEVFRALTRVPTPRTRFVRLSLNGRYYGLMLEVERIGPDFLEHNGRLRDRALYEADPPLPLFQSGACSIIPLPRSELYAEAYSKKIGPLGDLSDLRALVEDVVARDDEEGRSSRVIAAVKIESFLDYLMVMGLLQNQDHVRKNYFLSNQPNEGGELQWEFYPWDLDLTFGCLYDDAEENTICDELVFDFPEDRGVLPTGVRPTYPVEAYFNLLIHIALTDRVLRPGFVCRVCRALEGPFWNERLIDLLEARRGDIRPAVLDDPNDRSPSEAEFSAAVDEIRSFIVRRRDHLREKLRCE